MAGTTLSSWPLLVWNCLKDKGKDPRIAFAKAELNPAKLGDSQARYKAAKMFALWEAAIELCGDDDIGVDAGSLWTPTTFHALSFAWLASNSLLDGMQRMVRHGQIVNNSINVALASHGNEYRLNLQAVGTDINHHPAGTDAALAAFMIMSRLLVGTQFSPTRLELKRAHRKPGKLEALVGCATSYRHDESAVYIDARLAEKRLQSGNLAVAEANERMVSEYLLWLNRNDIVSAVKAKLLELLPAGSCTEVQVAEALYMNPRTMQRKLQAENCSFTSILNDVRMEMAEHHLRNRQLSLTEISYLLGFSEQANFTRAFKRWKGVSPSTYRHELDMTQAGNL